MKPGDPEYDDLVREEIDHYSRIFTSEAAAAETTLFQPVSSSWVEIEQRAAALVKAATGLDLTGHVLKRLNQLQSARMLSLGSGPGGNELAFARVAPNAQITCIDINPTLMTLGAERARAENLAVRFEAGDLNGIELPADEYDVVFCYASLHHVIELERLAEQIQRTLRRDGILITVDVCSRNGYLMWPETKKIVSQIFQTLPSRFRINHTAYAEPRLDEEIWEADTSASSMECVRSGEILPVLAAAFETRHFVPYFSICRRLLDTMYGPNYDLAQSLDAAMLNWIWELDCHYLNARQLQPETFFGMYTKRT